jgi:hypothetical protein
VVSVPAVLAVVATFAPAVGVFGPLAEFPLGPVRFGLRLEHRPLDPRFLWGVFRVPRPRFGTLIPFRIGR